MPVTQARTHNEVVNVTNPEWRLSVSMIVPHPGASARRWAGGADSLHHEFADYDTVVRGTVA